MNLALAAGFPEDEAELIGRADMRVDEKTPGSRYWWLHFNPTASLVFAPLEMRRARAAQRLGDRAAALEHLGRSIHMRQDAIGHGRFGLSHLMWDFKLMKRHPDDWDTMPVAVRARIEKATWRALRRIQAGEPEAEAGAL